MSTTPATKFSIEEIDTLARVARKARTLLTDRVASLQADLAAAQKRRREGIIDAASQAAQAEAELLAAVQSSPELFVKPKSMILHGLKCGYRKGSGSVEWTIDDDKLIERLKKRFGDLSPEVEQCVEVVEKIDSDGLRELDGKDLAALGVTIEGTGDVPFVKAADTELDKLVKAILKAGQPAKEGSK